MVQDACPMIGLVCNCGTPVNFEDLKCEGCQSALGFDYQSLQLQPLRDTDAVLCLNGAHYGVCNWTVDAESETGLCFGCSFNRIIPDLNRERNLERWKVLEEAKKRLLVSLKRISVPCWNGWILPHGGLVFDFLEDSRSREDLGAFIAQTGYREGVITINALEADPEFRIRQQLATKEKHRSVTGHFRHESGHYFWSILAMEPAFNQEFKLIFGEETLPYAESLEEYYSSGPQPNWREAYVSPYASSHPTEDWAETWSTYLMIRDAVESALSCHLIEGDPENTDFSYQLGIWSRLKFALQQINKGLGFDGVEEFEVNPSTRQKFNFVESAIGYLRTVDLPSATYAATQIQRAV